MHAYFPIFINSREFLRSAAPLMKTLIENYKVLIYNGEYDGITSTTSVDAAMNSTLDAEQRRSLTNWLVVF